MFRLKGRRKKVPKKEKCSSAGMPLAVVGVIPNGAQYAERSSPMAEATLLWHDRAASITDLPRRTFVLRGSAFLSTALVS